MSKEQREELANLCHEQWSGWMKYLFSECDFTKDGVAIIPQWATERWIRQMSTDYKNLSEDEKNSDRKEADKFLSSDAFSLEFRKGYRKAIERYGQ